LAFDNVDILTATNEKGQLIKALYLTIKLDHRHHIKNRLISDKYCLSCLVLSLLLAVPLKSTLKSKHSKSAQNKAGRAARQTGRQGRQADKAGRPIRQAGRQGRQVDKPNGTAHFKNANNCWNTNLSFYLETSGGQNSNLYLEVVHFLTRVLIRHLWQFKTVVFLHRCLLWALLLFCVFY
jgi:hypothetical protein